MYSWIWRKLPFGLYGKLTGSIALVSGVTALLWFVIFPWAEPLMPFDDAQIESGTGQPGVGEGAGDDTGEVKIDGTEVVPADPDDESFELPYSTASNNPEPTKSR